MKNPLRVTYIPNASMEGFSVEVKSEREAYLITQTLANLFLLHKNLIEDSNTILVEMYENHEWVNYYNEAEGMEWDEFVFSYEDYCGGE